MIEQIFHELIHLREACSFNFNLFENNNICSKYL